MEKKKDILYQDFIIHMNKDYYMGVFLINSFEFIFDEIRKKSEEYDILKMYTVLLIQDIKIKYMTIKKTFFFSLWLSRIIFMEKS